VRPDAPEGQTPILLEWCTRDHLSAIRAISPEGKRYCPGQARALDSLDVAALWARLLREVPGRIDLAEDFATPVRQRQPEHLGPWLQRMTTSMLEALQRLANGLHDDYAAVKVEVTLPWRSGPVAGHINHLEMLKRQMFGRARLDLLSRRYVRALGRGQDQAHAHPEPAAASRVSRRRVRSRLLGKAHGRT
jgi:hypothetical protein